MGYGKTAITLACIDAAPVVNGQAAHVPESAQGFLETKATLVIVPGTLTKSLFSKLCFSYLAHLSIVTLQVILWDSGREKLRNFWASPRRFW